MMVDLATRFHGKKLLALLLAVLLLLQATVLTGVYAIEEDAESQTDVVDEESTANVSAQGALSQEYVSGIYTYEVVNGQAIITDCDEWESGSITIPSKLGGYTVTEIDDYAFHYRDITGVIIPDTVKRIGENAFDWCSKLTYVNIGNGVTEIETDAFAWCSKLSNLTIGSSVKTIGHSAFYRTAISSLTLPNSVTSIGGYAFGFCTKLASVTIGSGLSNIGEGAFYSCSALASYSVNSGNSSFSSDSYGVLYNKDKTELIQYPIGNTRTNFTIPSSVTGIGYAAFQNSKNLSSVSFPNSVKTIGESAFLDCTALAGSVSLGNSVTSIGDFAFRNCPKITSVQIGTGLTSIGELAFYACKSVTAITVSTGNANFCSDNGVLFNKAKTELIQYPVGSSNTAYTVPAFVRTIRSGAFVQSQKLKTLTIANGTQKIEWGALEYCPTLEQIQIPNTVTELCYCNIRACNALKNLELPNSLMSIESKTVEYCNSLEYVHVPASVTEIAYYSYGTSIYKEFNIGTKAYICSDTTSCYAKTYADMCGIEFRLCGGHSSAVTLSKIAVKTMPTKTSYSLGDSFNQTGLTLTATYSDDSTKTVSSGFTCSGFSSTTEGMKTITVSYTENGVNATTTLTVIVNGSTNTRIPGDADGNGIVTVRDAAMISRYLAGGWNITLNELNADVDRSSSITVRDAALISRYLAGGWDVELLKATEYIEAKTAEEFSSACADLVSQSLESDSFDTEEALNDPYYFGRVIVNCSDYSSIDFAEFKASEVIFNDDGTVVLQFDDRDQAERCAALLKSLTTINYVEADAYIEVPEDIEIEELQNASDSTWGEKYINADKYAYYLENNDMNKPIKVAVIDSGVDTDHPYLSGRVSAAGANTINKNDPLNVEDDNGHGTHVAGIIKSCTNNLTNIKIVPIKVSKSIEDKDGNVTCGGTPLSIRNGISYAADLGCDVINISMESPYNTTSKFIEKAIQDAVNKGCTVVVAAGNGDQQHNPVDTARVCPANIEDAIVVGALDQNGNKGSFSNYGDSVDVCAPGVDVISSYKNSKYANASGTSQAAPHIAAVAAMFKLSHESCTPAQIEAFIKQYCVDKGPSGRDAFYGDGCPDMYDAIPDCTVSFNTNGGSAVGTKTTKNSSSVVLPTPTKSYKVTFDANGGTLTQSSVNTSCIFDGWYTTSSFSDTRHIGGESYMLLKDQTLYAKWASGQLGQISKPTRTCYSFAGWWTAPSGGAEYGSAFPISSNITLYAHWKENPIMPGLDDWVEESQVPAGTTIVARKTQYIYQDYLKTSSLNPNLGDGWTHYYTERTGWSGTIGPVYSDPSNGVRNVWSEQYVSGYGTKQIYVFYWWSSSYNGNPARAKIDGYPNKYTMEIEYYPSTTSDRPIAYYNGTIFKRYSKETGKWYYCWLDYEYSTTDYNNPQYSTRWYYQDPIYMYHFYKWSDWTTVWQDTPVYPSDERHVQTRTVCQYRVNRDLNT